MIIGAPGTEFRAHTKHLLHGDKQERKSLNVGCMLVQPQLNWPSKDDSTKKTPQYHNIGKRNTSICTHRDKAMPIKNYMPAVQHFFA